MTIARRHQVNVETTPYYHLIGRCVRRAFLCGHDSASGKNYQHRRQWLIDRLELLCSVFAVELCAYAILSNHYHLVVRLTPGQSASWSDEQVMSRWEKLYGIPTAIAQGMSPDAPVPQAVVAQEMIEVRRQRLGDLGWFMKCLNEHIARRANLEEDCTGSFWEGRYRSQALLDEKALLACMAYVDLNPIRAGLARTLDGSSFTAVQARINTEKGQRPPLPLVPFEDQCQTGKNPLPGYLHHYLELLDWTGRALQENKGAITGDIKPVLTKMGFDQSTWLAGIRLFGQPMFQVIGPANRMRRAARANNRCWYRGTAACQVVFGPP